MNFKRYPVPMYSNPRTQLYTNGSDYSNSTEINDITEHGLQSSHINKYPLWKSLLTVRYEHPDSILLDKDNMNFHLRTMSGSTRVDNHGDAEYYRFADNTDTDILIFGTWRRTSHYIISATSYSYASDIIFVAHDSSETISGSQYSSFNGDNFSYSHAAWSGTQKHGAWELYDSISEILYINKRTIAFSLAHHDMNIYDDVKSPGIIIVTVSNNNNICVISPSKFCGADKSLTTKYYDSSDRTYKTAIITNKLRCYTKNTRSTSTYYNTIPFYSEFGDKTILNPVLVKASDEYCPGVFYVPISQYIIYPTNDTFLFINGKTYWYNGFIAVELDEEE